MTSNLPRRIWHRNRVGSHHAERHAIDRLVWAERHDDIARGKSIKRWPRAWKFNAIEEHNRDWRDPSVDL